MVLGIFVHEKAHHMASNEACTASNNNCFFHVFGYCHCLFIIVSSLDDGRQYDRRQHEDDNHEDDEHLQRDHISDIACNCG